MSSDPGQWPMIAAHWDLIGPPLRPTPADIALVGAAVERWHSELQRPPQVLILGVTPEFWSSSWPDGTFVRAADRSPEMIANVWPGNPRDAILTEWADLPLLDCSIDLVLCDGGWHLLDQAGQQRLAAELGRVLTQEGRFVVRLFAPPHATETTDEVVADLWSGAIPSLNHLKLRLGMALANADGSVKLDDVWTFVNNLEPDRARLAARLGWNADQLAAIDAYRGSTTSYHWRSPSDVVATLGSKFGVDSIESPNYLLGDRCPTLALRRHGRAS